MIGLRYLLACVVAPLFLLAAAFKLRDAYRSVDGKRQNTRQGALYVLAALAWLLAAFLIRA
jgi:hypothetical protein